MRPCVVLTCTYGNRRGENKSLYYFRFPEQNKELLKEWLTRCGLNPVSDPGLISQYRVCSRHFDEEDFERDLRLELLGVPSRKRLKNDAVPHLFLMNIKEEPIDEEYPDIIDLDFTSEEECTREGVYKELDSCQQASDEQEANLQQEQLYQELQIENIGIVSSTVQITHAQNASSSIQYAPSSLPASQTWPGEYDFNVTFRPQEKNTKGVAWTYSKMKDKLYVGKDCPCPINFSASAVMPVDVFVRVMALYSSPEQVSDVVKRCVNHSMDEIKSGIVEAEHLIRCESDNAVYQEDPLTKRHSVLVPFENPPVGQSYSTYIFKFVCFGSCSGGPNRRPLMLVFSLERRGEVIGRRKVDVKICACPGRDRKTEESQAMGAAVEDNESKIDIKLSKKRKEFSLDLDMPSKKRPLELVSLVDTFNFTRGVIYPVSKKPKIPQDSDGPFVLNVKDKDCYDFLVQMHKLYDMCKVMKSLSPEKALLYYKKSGGKLPS